MGVQNGAETALKSNKIVKIVRFYNPFQFPVRLHDGGVECQLECEKVKKKHELYNVYWSPKPAPERLQNDPKRAQLEPKTALVPGRAPKLPKRTQIQAQTALAPGRLQNAQKRTKFE